MGKLWELAKTLAAIAILGGISWSAYSLWNRASPRDDETIPGASFNCRKALADLATGYTCRDSAHCTMTDHELDELKKLETTITLYCD
jgi:hypothetical protein